MTSPSRDLAREPLALFLATLVALALVCCGKRGERTEREEPDLASSAAKLAPSSPASTLLEARLRKQRLANLVAYIPPQCFTKTSAVEGEPAKNPCYVCHTDSPAPNFASDGSLQLLYSLPAAAATNPWTNLFAPPVSARPRMGDEEVRKYVRQSNYVMPDGSLALARALDALPTDWDIDGNGTWEGYKPDVWLNFDDRGFDRTPAGVPTGWRAFGYYPFPGAFFPTNGSADDVLVRLDPRLQEDRHGRFDPRIYELNLSIVESLITRRDVAIDPVDEASLGVDIDLNGRLARADHVTFDAPHLGAESTRMRYVGLAEEEQRAGRFPIAPGLFPLGTEFFHTVRYLDVDPSGAVVMAPRMKEVRYAKKTAYLAYDALRGRAAADAREQSISRDGSRRVNWRGEAGIDNGQGWVLQGFIEDQRGDLRPQTREETVYCAGCHGGIGATTDSVFSFARKLGASEVARGWFHWSQRDLHGLREPVRADGKYEYATYLEEAGAGDELRENTEVLSRFFDDDHHLRASEVVALRADVTRLLLPSAARALDLDRAYLAVVREQSFARGRDAVLAPSKNVYATVPIGEPTGVPAPAAFAALVSAGDSTPAAQHDDRRRGRANVE
jgi:hypothetical protein